jgi:hypothetical protein
LRVVGFGVTDALFVGQFGTFHVADVADGEFELGGGVEV